MKLVDQEDLARRNDKVRRSWAKQAPRYDKQIGFFERRVFGRGHRAWACSRASGDVLEVAIGTALNLPHYPEDVRLTGLDLSAEMLDLGRNRAREACEYLSRGAACGAAARSAAEQAAHISSEI
ncbi:MAG: hypothetical protein M3285_05425 [Actinomycetota bacterium]|nr:hypothetical protein [Actinomycetota bacterium]